MAEGLKSLKRNRKFETIIVEGNLSWEYPRHDLKRLSYLLQYAVTVDTPQTLTQKITFTNGFKTNTIDSVKWINDVNLIKIQEDAIYKNQQAVSVLY